MKAELKSEFIESHEKGRFVGEVIVVASKPYAKLRQWDGEEWVPVRWMHE